MGLKPNRVCVLTNTAFHTYDPDESVSEEAKSAIIKVIQEKTKTNEQFRREVITALLTDEEIVKALCRALFSAKATDLGLATSGSIADLFCKEIRKSGKRKAHKAT
jgi:predicted transcriptional regulator